MREQLRVWLNGTGKGPSQLATIEGREPDGQFRVKLLNTNYVVYVLPNMARETKSPKKRFTVFGKRARPRRRIVVEGVVYTEPSVYGGDFFHMIRDPRYKNALFLFNDNVRDFKEFYHDCNAIQEAGGGNACVRPWQIKGHARGVTTGPYFSTLDTVCDGRTAKEWIDMSVHHVVDTFLKYPRKTRLIYSAESVNSSRIGVGIFRHQIGDDVLAYISNKIRDIPTDVCEARKRM